MADGTPKTSQEVLTKVRYEYDAGTYKSVSELANRYGISVPTLHARIKREGWDLKKEELIRKADKSFEKKALSQAESYLNRTFKRVERYEKIIEASQENLGSKTSEGIPLLDPDAINSYTQSESRIHALAKSCLMIPEAKHLDITSKGQSLGESLLSAIAKAREGTSPQLTEADVDKILEAEIVENDDSEPKT